MAGFSFTERTPLEAGFAEVFRREVVPILERHEARRRKAARKVLTWAGYAAAGGLAGALLAHAAGWRDGVLIAPALGILAAVIAYIVQRDEWRKGLGREVLPVMCRFLGGMEADRTNPSTTAFAELGMVPPHRRVEIDNTVTGSFGDLSYVLAEVRLKKRGMSGKGRRRYRDVFRGLLLRIKLAEKVPPILFARNRGGVGNWLAERFSDHRRDRARVATGHPEFERLYTVYSADPSGARRFVTPALARGLIEVARTETGRIRHLAAAARGRNFYLALPLRRDFLGMGSLFRPLAASEADLHQALADLDLPRRVITALRGY